MEEDAWDKVKSERYMWWKLILGVAGFICLAVVVAVLKMVITEAKEEADNIERASGNK